MPTPPNLIMSYDLVPLRLYTYNLDKSSKDHME